MSDTDNRNPPTKPVGVIVTIERIYDKVLNIDETLGEQVADIHAKINSLENKVTALYVTNGITLATIIVIVTEAFKK